MGRKSSARRTAFTSQRGLGKNYMSAVATYEGLTATLEPIVRVREKGKFFHFVRRSELVNLCDKKTAKALCGATALETWQFTSGSRACQTCSSLAGKCVVMPPPIFPDAVILPSSHGQAWNGPPALFESKYDGQCRACGHSYNTGDKIYWKRGEGSRHQACGPHTSEQSSPRPSPYS